MRRNPISAAVIALVIVGLAVSTAVASGKYRYASTSRCDIGYGTCPGTDTGYRLLDASGGIDSYGADAGRSQGRGEGPFVGIAADKDGNGYWVVNADGRISALGDATFHGQALGRKFTDPISALASPATGGGYWIVNGAGRVFNYGTAGWFGSEAGKPVDGTVDGITGTPDGGGYWLLTDVGKVYAFGDAAREGSPDVAGTVAIASAPEGQGYWITTSTGTVYAYGAAHHYNRNSAKTYDHVTAIVPTPDGKGYGLITKGGSITSFGTWTQHGNPHDSDVSAAA